ARRCVAVPDRRAESDRRRPADYLPARRRGVVSRPVEPKPWPQHRGQPRVPQEPTVAVVARLLRVGEQGEMMRMNLRFTVGAAAGLLLLAATEVSAQERCTNASLSGSYAFKVDGTVVSA